MRGTKQRTAATWPAALLPGALLLALLAGAAGTASTSDEPPVTELHVVSGR